METKDYPILVVDDDPDFIEIARTVLESEGYNVIAASNGNQALEQVRTEHPSLRPARRHDVDRPGRRQREPGDARRS